MSLDLTKLEKLVELVGGTGRARCPACAEDGHDKAGEHLRIYPDGKFGCCVFPRDREHRKRIFALAGDRTRQGILVRSPATSCGVPIKRGLLGHLGRVFESSPQPPIRPDEGPKTIGIEPETPRTPRTGRTDSIQSLIDFSRTARTPLPLLTREADKMCTESIELKEFGDPVRSVREEGVESPPFRGSKVRRGT
jgi:hypothetical protein